MRKLVVSAIVIGIVSVVMIYLLNSFGGGINVKDMEFFFTRSWWGIIGISLLLISWFTDALNTYLLVKTSKGSITFLQSFKSTIIGNFFSMLTPSSTGGQPMQVVYMNKIGVPPGISTSIMVFKMIAWQGAIEIVAIFELRRAIFLMNSVPAALSLAFIGFVISSFTIAILILFNFNRKVYNTFFSILRKTISLLKFSKKMKPKIDKILNRFDREIENYADSTKYFTKNSYILIIVFFLSIISSVSGLLLVFPAIAAMGLFHNGIQDILDVLAIQSLATLIIYFSPTPGSSGTAEGEFYLFFSAIIPLRYLATITLEWSILRYFIPLFVGFVIVVIESLKGLKIEPKKESDIIKR
jgi:uncharacterized protein (TIRG00374 family)|uniref:Flippase-like domain-containing protein n=1 Tax=Mesoaciditoga lauensis TaxID=1495039 RepID=A0A7V3RFH1_9BACT